MTAAAETADATLRRWAIGLGAAGLAPFVGLALLAFAWPAASGRWAVEALAVYAVAVLSFIGALHWGVALAGRDAMQASRVRLALVWSVVPSLYAAGVVLAPRLGLAATGPQTAGGRSTLALLAAGFVAAWLVDLALYRGHPAPRWFTRLRTLLTVGAALSLLAASSRS